MLVLEDRDIAQIDATVIVGALIFLALAFDIEAPQKAGTIYLTAIIIVPFSISAVLALFGHQRSSKIISALGFFVLIAFIIIAAAAFLSFE